MEICKFSRVGNGRNMKISSGDQQYPDDEDDGELKNGVAGDDGAVVANRLLGWHPSSRIIRVSRASGGKDRHSKVWTSKGLRDRRVRLSVTTAIQFYDLQDRLGYDQPSKAVEWLIKAAGDSIAELPSLDGEFPDDTPKQLEDEKSEQLGLDGGDKLDKFGGNQDQTLNRNNLSLSKSGCSSASDTSKGSGLSLSRSDVRLNRVKARERARVRAKEKENVCHVTDHNQNQNSSSFTELLTSQNLRQWSPAAATPMDYFSSGGLINSSRAQQQRHSSAFQLMSMSSFHETHNQEHHHQNFPFVPHDHLIPVTTTTAAGGGDLNFNFMNRGTLQSNISSSSSLPSNLVSHRYATPSLDGSNLPFFISTENHHHHQQFPPPELDSGSRLQLYYGDGNSDQKGKGKH